MSELCDQCLHQRPADQGALDGLNAPGAPPSVQASLNRQRAELLAEIRVEELVFQSQGRGGSALNRRPVRHPWCAAQSRTPEGVYYFCNWLTQPACKYFKSSQQAPADAHQPSRTSLQEIATPKVETRRDPIVTQPAVRETAKAVEPTPTPAPPLKEPQNTPSDGWALPIGASYALCAMSQQTAGSALGAGSFEIDYAARDLPEQPTIRGAGLRQTYLIFGGPGAGKTYYFKYLLSGFLAHPDKPGCLLLDPKGGELTPWLETELAKSGRQLTVLTAGATKNAFNVLGQDLQPKELGRLLSEVVLAGAAGIDEGWSVLIADLLESAAVVIAADPTARLTAAALLRDILYRSDFKFKDGRTVKEYPIVIRAQTVSRQAKALDVRISCDRISEYFSNSLEPRQRRFVRQIIERSLGELMLPEWQYMSSSTTGGDNLYSDIIERGRVVSVAVGQSSPAFQRSLSTLVKSIFQQAVLANLSRRAKEQKVVPFFILACDEYAQAITEGETGLVSDSRFFSLSREAGCLSLLALQSVATGRSRFSAAMRDRWDGVLGNVTVKFFMRLNDVETAELGSSLAGSQHSFVEVLSQQQSAQGLTASNSVSMVEHPRVPPWYLTNRMPQGHAFVHGTLDGKSAPTTVFVRAPSPQKPSR